MNIIEQTINATKLGGVIMYPLIILFIMAIALIIDKILIYKKLVKLPKDLLELIETYGFSWNELEEKLKNLPSQNYFAK
jgi:biopolymer transport protein ExbB